MIPTRSIAFLDPQMVYSCAYFRDWNNDLATGARQLT
jgi:cyclopropane fatty-acyl-phospholipid synthase-like methyltransferase